MEVCYLPGAALCVLSGSLFQSSQQPFAAGTTGNSFRGQK